MNESHGMSRKTETYADAGVWPHAFGKLQRDDAERHDDEDLADDLAPAGQAEAALAAHLHVVVDEADDAEADHHPEDEPSRDRRRVVAGVGADEVADDRADDEDRAAHGGRAALLLVARVVDVLGGADDLTPAPLAEQPQEDGREEERECQRDRCCRQE